MPRDVQNKIDDAFKERRLDLEFDELFSKDSGEIYAALAELSIDIDNEREKVTIYCE